MEDERGSFFRIVMSSLIMSNGLIMSMSNGLIMSMSIESIKLRRKQTSRRVEKK
jgi:hypothetical protein